MALYGLNDMKKRHGLLLGIFGMFSIINTQKFIPPLPQMSIFHQSGYKKLDLTPKPKQKKERKKSKTAKRERRKQR